MGRLWAIAREWMRECDRHLVLSQVVGSITDRIHRDR